MTNKVIKVKKNTGLSSLHNMGGKFYEVKYEEDFEFASGIVHYYHVTDEQGEHVEIKEKYVTVYEEVK